MMGSTSIGKASIDRARAVSLPSASGMGGMMGGKVIFSLDGGCLRPVPTYVFVPSRREAYSTVWSETPVRVTEEYGHNVYLTDYNGNYCSLPTKLFARLLFLCSHFSLANSRTVRLYNQQQLCLAPKPRDQQPSQHYQESSESLDKVHPR